MYWHPVNANDRKSNFLAQPRQSADREITQVLVIDGVVFEPLQQFGKVRDLDDDQPIGGEQAAGCVQEVSRLIDVSKHVVADDDPSGTVSREDTLRQLWSEELADGVDTAGTRDIGDIARGLDAEFPHGW